MQPFCIHILGCGSALPTRHHNPSSQIIEVRGKYFMIDCGEGTQTQVRRSKTSFSKLYAVFITHLHGDHVLGLIGMISTFGLQGRTAPLHVYAPEAYGKLFQMELDMFCSNLDFPVVFHPVDTSRQTLIYEDRSITVETIPLRHRMPCAGYLFKEKPGARHINPEMMQFHNVPRSQVDNLRAGLDWVNEDGETIPNDVLTTPPDSLRAYAYCSDTSYLPHLGHLLKELTPDHRLTLYHESTYGEDMHAKAEKYLHSTAREAALTARDAEAERLLLGHYSQRYDDETVLLREAQQVFPDSSLTSEGMTIKI
ncbi:MAG: ribonuclease Z [Prevotella sp.]|nr:ribonuclease Z [Prevotella sp.]